MRVDAIATTAASAREMDTVLWVGAGRPLFVGHTGLWTEGTIGRLDSPAELERYLLDARASGGSEAVLATLRDYFAAGGRGCYVLETVALEDAALEDAALEGGTESSLAELIGEDGGPGQRSGLCAAGDLEDCGTVVVPGCVETSLLRALADFVAARPSLFLVVEERGDAPSVAAVIDELLAGREASGSERPGDPRERVGVVPAPATGAPSGAYPSGARIGRLERYDFDPARPRGFPPRDTDVATLGGRWPALGAWRRWEGLRRSLDRGTRWSVLEIDDGFLCARIEREIAAFLRGLASAGFFGGSGVEDPFDVCCRAAQSEERQGLTARVTVEVRVRLDAAG